MTNAKRRKIICIIPARLKSTRLEHKPLVQINGRPLIRYVYENIANINHIDRVIVAADDDLIIDAVKSFGGDVVLTPNELKSGTDRVAHVSRELDADLIVNVQCDEPFVRGEMISAGVEPFMTRDGVVMGSLKTRITSADELFDPNVVKVVTDLDNNAIYFSRFPVPYLRDEFSKAGDPRETKPDLSVHSYYKHIGIYFYDPVFLQTFSKLPVSSLERAERLEQLRALESGYKIVVPTTEFDSIGVDTEEDLQRVRDIIRDTGGHNAR